MARRVGFGDGDPDDRSHRARRRADARSSGGRGRPGAALLLALAVLVGAALWIMAGFGGPDEALRALARAHAGERPWDDVLATALPPLAIAAVILAMFVPRLLRSGSRRDVGQEPPSPSRQRQAAPAAQGAAEKAATDAADTHAGRRKGIPRIAVGFIAVWLFAWTIGIINAVGRVVADLDSGLQTSDLFLLLWIAVAIVAWRFVWRLLMSETTRPRR